MRCGSGALIQDALRDDIGADGVSERHPGGEHRAGDDEEAADAEKAGGEADDKADGDEAGQQAGGTGAGEADIRCVGRAARAEHGEADTDHQQAGQQQAVADEGGEQRKGRRARGDQALGFCGEVIAVSPCYRGG